MSPRHLVFTAARTLASGPLTAPGAVIVSNLGDPTNGNINAFNVTIAGRFTLDAGTTNWTVEGVTLLLDAGGSPIDSAVTLFADAGGLPGSLFATLGTLQAPASTGYAPQELDV